MNIAALLAGLFSGISGSMGLGGGTVLIIYLTVFKKAPQLKSQGINLIFFIPCAILAVIIYIKQRLIDIKVVMKIALFGILGALLGILLTHFISSYTISKIFGGLLILLGIKDFFKSKRKSVAQEEK